MNIVRSRPLGQFPGEGIASDLTLGPQQAPADNFPMYYDPGLLIAEQGAPPAAPSPPAPSVTVPQPPGAGSGSPIYATFGPIGTLDTTAASAIGPAPGAISPAPHVTIPLSTASGFLSSSLAGIPMVAWLGIGLVGILALSSGGGRRRR
jgi:hypothetical protein